MSVAPIDEAIGNGDEGLAKVDSVMQTNGNGSKQENEALMILGVDRAVDEDVRKGLMGEDGLLEAGVVVL